MKEEKLTKKVQKVEKSKPDPLFLTQKLYP